MHLIIIALAAIAIVQAETALLLEKTFPRDNAICYVGGKRLEVVIRGSNKYTEPREARFGEHVLYTLKRVRPVYKFLPVGRDQTDTFKFFKGQDPNTLCTRALGHMLGKEKFALLFLKENFPHPGKLVIQLFDAKTLAPSDVLETEHLSDRAVSMPGGVAFNSHPERLQTQMGKIIIEGSEHTWQDRGFPVWIGFDQKGFNTSLPLTFKKFPWKRFFKDQADFSAAAGWSAADKRFSNSIIYLAVNHPRKRECILLSKERLKLDGSEPWRCRQRE